MFYKIYLNSANKITGDFTKGTYRISLPNTFEAVGKNWGIAVESFCSGTVNNLPVYITTNIPLKNTYTSIGAKNILLCINSYNYQQVVTSNRCSCILANTIEFYQNSTIEISFENALTGEAFNYSKGWAMTLVIYNII
jgi:hypothetical protein